MSKAYKIAFLDRDGVLNVIKKKQYISKIDEFVWMPGAKKAIKILKEKGYKIIIVSNQSGIARGYFSISSVRKLHFFIKRECKNYGAKIDDIYFCPYYFKGIIPKYTKKSSLRKPQNGMFKLAQKKWNIDLRNSFMIGDSNSDMLFAKKSKIRGYLFKEKNLYLFLKKKILS